MNSVVAKYRQRFPSSVGSHVVSFALLHELTAILPLPLIYYTLQAYPSLLKDLPPPAEKSIQSINRSLNSISEKLSLGQSAVVDEDSRLVVHLAASYGLIKVLMPWRLALSAALTPWFSRRVVDPVMKIWWRS